MENNSQNSGSCNNEKSHKSTNAFWKKASNNIGIESLIDNRNAKKRTEKSIDYLDIYKAYRDSYIPSNLTLNIIPPISNISITKEILFGNSHKINPQKMEYWEKVHDEHNSYRRKTLNKIGSNPVTRPIARIRDFYGLQNHKRGQCALKKPATYAGCI